MPTRSVAWGALALSLGLHGTAGLWLGAGATSARPAAPGRTAPLIDVAFSVVGRDPDVAGDGAVDPTPVSPAEPDRPLRPGRRPSAQNVDAFDRGGRGGGPGPTEVVLLVSGADAVTLQDAPWNARTGRQLQRIRTARDRATWEDRRATPNPGDTPFLASGDGTLRERRRPGPMPRRGVPVRRAGASPGAAGADPSPGPIPVEAAGAAGAAAPRPPRGLPEGAGARSDAAGPVAHGRPPVDRGPAATPSAWRGRVRDNRDAELLAADMASSMLDASRRRGRVDGEGPGGRAGPGAPGIGRVVDDRPGGRALAHAPGPGLHGGLDTGDPRYVRWKLALRRRIEGRLAFPRERQLRMDQGTSLYRVRVFRDGRLASRPRLLRSSGFDDLDHAARQAIERALPGPPVPAELAPRLDVVPVTIPVEFWNPVVR